RISEQAECSPENCLSDGAGTLHFESDGAHQLERVALLNDSGSKTVIEDHLPIFQMIFKVSIAGKRRERIRNFGQSQIVSGDQTDGPSRDQSAQNSFGANRPVVRVRSMQDFI